MTCTLSRVPVDQVMRVWATVGPMIERGLARDRMRAFSAEDIGAKVLSGAWQLWIIANGTAVIAALVTDILRNERATVLSIRFIAGKDARRWIHLIEDLKAWGRSVGCTDFVMNARKGWLRLLGVPMARVSRVTIQEAL